MKWNEIKKNKTKIKLQAIYKILKIQQDKLRQREKYWGKLR